MVPPNACDCHVHVFLDPTTRYPFAPKRAYTPPPASVEQLRDLQARLGLARVVIVQPSVYGADNAATLEGMRQLGPGRARGVAVIDDAVSSTELDRLTDAGVRGVRVNLELMGETDPGAAVRRLQNAARQIAGRGWHIQIFTQLWMIAALADCIAGLGIPVVLDHFAGARGADGTGHEEFQRLLKLVSDGKVYVKLSAAYRCSVRAPDFDDMAPLARALIAANPDRMLWGSDWPHPNAGGRLPLNEISPPLVVDDARLFGRLAVWAGDPAIYRRILVENPARLYDFGLS